MDQKPWYKYYDPTVNLSPSYPEISLKEQFVELVKKQPQKPFIYYLDQVFTYEEVNRLACKLANAMAEKGVKKGDRVAVCLSNSPEFIISVHACLKIGAIIVPTNPRYTKRELVHSFLDSGSETIICHEEKLALILEIMQEHSDVIRQIIFVGKKSSFQNCCSQSVYRYDDLIKTGPDIEPEVEISLDDIVLLMYTGGTTGVSKGCCITNMNLIAVASGWKQMCEYFTDMNYYKLLSSTPFYHIHGFQTGINSNILIGGSVIVLPELTVDNIIEAVNRHEPNVWPAVPNQIKAVLKHPGITTAKMQKIQHIGCGACSLSVDVINEFESIVGVPIIEGYGASETSMAVASNPYCKRKVGSVGIPYPNVDFKVVDLETGEKELKIGEVGELCFKGPQVIKEYWRNPEETAIAFRDGWWHSGDVGYMDADGFIFILDRKKDMIICSGFNVYCTEVEHVLTSHPKIADAAVIGVPDEKRDESVKAFLVVKDGESITFDEIKEHCRKNLAAYKVPVYFEIIDELPRTHVQKIDRNALRNREFILNRTHG